MQKLSLKKVFPFTWYFFLIFNLLPIQEYAYSEEVEISSVRNYEYNPIISIDEWKKLEPFFLPINHPTKTYLDQLFSNNRPILSEKAMEKAGFSNNIIIRGPQKAVIGHHPKLKGYIIKTFLDIQPVQGEWIAWRSRILGAEAIRKCIEHHNFKEFRVPKKWIYPIPINSTPPLEPIYYPKYFILVEEDMHLLSHKETKKTYRNKMTKKTLDHLYIVLSEVGLIDSVYADNIPFNKSGKICFIDTEHFNKGPVKFERIKRYLSPSLQVYWQHLIDCNGPLNK
ncbi:MAG: hypothetical protein H0W88_12240 [Parachlamydiaceae bacterium]|nr:hypothetical protein [Parachlamydiaceae bacterium]